MLTKIISQAKKKLRDYQIKEKCTAGLVLNGNEIKSLRNYQTSIDEAYVSLQQRELYIVNMYIAPYKYSHAGSLTNNYNGRRKRKLLLHQKEIRKISQQLKNKNYSLIPLLLFVNVKG